jgi:F-type H+-transporting ATPase subunit delta
MTNKAAAIRYARALFDVAVKEQSDLEQIERQLAEFLDLFTQHPTLEHVMMNPAVPATRKRATVAELTTRLGIASVLAKLLALLAERDRLILLPDLLSTYRDKLLDHRQVVRAEVTTAAALTAERAQEVERRLAQATGRTVTVAARVDPAIIGGLVARVGSIVYDGSVSRQLEKIKNRLVEGT